MSHGAALIDSIRMSCLRALSDDLFDSEMAYWNYRVLAGRIRRTPWVIVEELREG